jgi:molybdopterin synthase sulfur carrier subunit
MRVLYFAWLRQRAGVGEETISLPDDVRDVAGLVELLKARGPGYAEALKDLESIRVAVNQEFASLDTAISDSDEVALFPPMTGG